MSIKQCSADAKVKVGSTLSNNKDWEEYVSYCQQDLSLGSKTIVSIKKKEIDEYNEFGLPNELYVSKTATAEKLIGDKIDEYLNTFSGELSRGFLMERLMGMLNLKFSGHYLSKRVMSVKDKK